MPDLGIEQRLKRKMGRPARVDSVAIRFTKQESAQLAEAARRHGITVREWAREELLRASAQSQLDQAVFTELVALRLLMTNVLRPLALGQTITPEAFQAITAGVRNDKHDVAQQLLAQYQPNHTEEQ